jgi:hypothetical protein
MSITYRPGVYRGQIFKWGLSKVISTGNPQFIISFQIQGEVDQSDPDRGLIQCQEGERSIFRVITPNTIDYILQDLEKLGYDKEGFEFLSPEHPGAFNFLGMEIEVICSHETYEGKAREKWSFAWGGGGMEIQPLENSEVKKLNAMFGKKLKNQKSVNGPQTASQVMNQDRKPVAAKRGDEVPF